MLYKTLSAAVYGIDASLIEVEVDIAPVKTEQDTFTTVGLPDTTVRESRERIRAALKNSGYDIPSTTTTINLAPADIRKEGSGFDLPMALGILGAYGGLNNKPPDRRALRGRAVARRRHSRRARRFAHRGDRARQQHSQAHRARGERARSRAGGRRRCLSGALADGGGAAAEHRQRHPAGEG